AVLIRRALARLPEFADAHANLGNALRLAGRAAEAVASYARATELRPDVAEMHANLARAEGERGHHAAAEATARLALALAPRLVEGHAQLGLALLHQRRLGPAEASLRRALRLDPARADTLSGLGLLLTERERFAAALACHRRALALRPDDPAALYALGLTQYRAHDVAGAAQSFRRALACAPRFAQAWNGLGRTLRAAGQFPAAIGCFRHALAIQPRLADAWRNLALTGGIAVPDESVGQLETLLADPALAAGDRVAAGFAIAKLHDDAGRHDAAFRHYAAANATFRAERAHAGEHFDASLLARQVDHLIATYTPAFFARAAGLGNPSALPVFVVGMPRSGSTLVEQVITSHSAAHGAGELSDIRRMVMALQRRDVRDIAVQDWAVQDWAVQDWSRLDKRRMADAHLARLAALGGGSLRVVDKLPDNILNLGVIATLFPGARVIFCTRDPRDTCVSCFFQMLQDGNLWSYDLADCGRRWLAMRRLQAHWLESLPVRMLEVRYEAMVAAFEEQSRRLVDFLGLEWEPGCLEFHRTARVVTTASAWQVRQALYPDSVGRWQRYEAHLAPLLEVLEGTRELGRPDTSMSRPLSPAPSRKGRGSAVHEAPSHCGGLR
ncbi:MAG: sulfotransferase, partial [Acetobacteraceae bacterium]